MFSESVAIADSVTSSPFNAPWSVVQSACPNQVITDLCACWDWVVLRGRTVTDTSERRYHGGTPRSKTASGAGARISDVVEEGRVEYVPVSAPALGPAGPSKLRSSPSEWKRKISRRPMKLPRRFDISSPPASPPKRFSLEDLPSASALAPPASRGKSRRSGRDRRAAPVFQMGFP